MIPFLARTFFRVQERLLRRPSFAILRELRASERWPRERVEALQWDRLRAVLQAAYDHTPYWREVLDAHSVRPADVRSWDDFRRLPLLEKATLRARREDMVWRDQGPRLTLIRTSGSTNEALQFYTNSNREAQINAARMRGHEWIGVPRARRRCTSGARPWNSASRTA
jgi:phenylacetate-CoA ligase